MDAGYRHHLAGAEGLTLQTFAATVDPVVWVVAVKLEPRFFPQGRDAVMAGLSDAGIESRPGFYSANAMPHLYGGAHAIPICDELSAQIISLPSFPQLTAEEIARVCAALFKERRGG